MGRDLESYQLVILRRAPDPPEMDDATLDALQLRHLGHKDDLRAGRHPGGQRASDRPTRPLDPRPVVLSRRFARGGTPASRAGPVGHRRPPRRRGDGVVDRARLAPPPRPPVHPPRPLTPALLARRAAVTNYSARRLTVPTSIGSRSAHAEAEGRSSLRRRPGAGRRACPGRARAAAAAQQRTGLLAAELDRVVDDVVGRDGQNQHADGGEISLTLLGRLVLPRGRGASASSRSAALRRRRPSSASGDGDELAGVAPQRDVPGGRRKTPWSAMISRARISATERTPASISASTRRLRALRCRAPARISSRAARQLVHNRRWTTSATSSRTAFLRFISRRRVDDGSGHSRHSESLDATAASGSTTGALHDDKVERRTVVRLRDQDVDVPDPLGGPDAAQSESRQPGQDGVVAAEEQGRENPLAPGRRTAMGQNDPGQRLAATALGADPMR